MAYGKDHAQRLASLMARLIVDNGWRCDMVVPFEALERVEPAPESSR